MSFVVLRSISRCKKRECLSEKQTRDKRMLNNDTDAMFYVSVDDILYILAGGLGKVRHNVGKTTSLFPFRQT